MKVFKPATFTNYSSNVSSNEYQEYNPIATYDLGDRVIVNETKRVYLSRLSGNTRALDDTIGWLDEGVQNFWRAFDGVVGQQCENANQLTFTLNPDTLIDAIALFNLEAQSVRVRVTDPSLGEIYNQIKYLSDAGSLSNWHEYFYTPVSLATEMLFADIPFYSGNTVEITIEDAAIAKVGEIVLGYSESLGLSQYGSKIGLSDYSSKTIDEFGSYDLAVGEYLSVLDVDVVTDIETTLSLKRYLSSIQSEKVVWYGGEGEQYGLFTYGFYKDFEIVLNDGARAFCNLEIEGLI